MSDIEARDVPEPESYSVPTDVLQQYLEILVRLRAKFPDGNFRMRDVFTDDMARAIGAPSRTRIMSALHYHQTDSLYLSTEKTPGQERRYFWGKPVPALLETAMSTGAAEEEPRQSNSGQLTFVPHRPASGTRAPLRFRVLEKTEPEERAVVVWGAGDGATLLVEDGDGDGDDDLGPQELEVKSVGHLADGGEPSESSNEVKAESENIATSSVADAGLIEVEEEGAQTMGRHVARSRAKPAVPKDAKKLQALYLATRGDPVVLEQHWELCGSTRGAAKQFILRKRNEGWLRKDGSWLKQPPDPSDYRNGAVHEPPAASPAAPNELSIGTSNPTNDDVSSLEAQLAEISAKKAALDEEAQRIEHELKEVRFKTACDAFDALSDADKLRFFKRFRPKQLEAFGLYR